MEPLSVQRPSHLTNRSSLLHGSSGLNSPKKRSIHSPQRHIDNVGPKKSVFNSPKNVKKIRLCFKENKTHPTSPRASLRTMDEKPVVNFNSIGNWRHFCDKLRDLDIYIRQFLETIEKGEDPYDTIRQYVDFIQDQEFNDLLALISTSDYQQVIKEAFILERWVIFVVFYMCLERLLGDIQQIVLRIAILIYQNFIYYLKLIYIDRHSCDTIDTVKTFKSFLKGSILPKNVDFYMFEISKRDIRRYISSSNVIMREFLTAILPLDDKRISEGVELLLSTKFDDELDDSLDFLLNSFCEYFVNKGIVTVEHPDQNSESEILHPSIDVPFIKKSIHGSQEYTLVLDLDETLVHFIQNKNGGQVLLRPHVHRFLAEMARYYEIIVFTAAQQEYADWIIDRLDESGSISHRLYRQHTYFFGNANIKDLTKVGRDLHRTIIMDNIAENFSFIVRMGSMLSRGLTIGMILCFLILYRC